MLLTMIDIVAIVIIVAIDHLVAYLVRCPFALSVGCIDAIVIIEAIVSIEAIDHLVSPFDVGVMGYLGLMGLMRVMGIMSSLV